MSTFKPLGSSKPIEFEEYPSWLATQGVNVDVHASHYEAVCRRLIDGFSKCSFWTKTVSGLKEVDATYQIEKKYPLISRAAPELVVKPWNSFLHKTFRRNVLANENFPNPPSDGWTLPDNWFERIHDILRTTIEVKYLDGVAIVLKALKEWAEQERCFQKSSLEARVNGYYGAHFECGFSEKIPDISWKQYDQRITVEIQVTTSIKEVIKKLLHAFYEDSRKKPKQLSIEEISWNYHSPQFNAAYLGHILHYVEGMIIEVRDQPKA
jgi:ppGpp synthetase/RelA/SpoT-type nucleotidyltranferase